MNKQYDGYYDDIKPLDADNHEIIMKTDITKRVVILIGGLILFVTVAVALSMFITA